MHLPHSLHDRSPRAPPDGGHPPRTASLRPIRLTIAELLSIYGRARDHPNRDCWELESVRLQRWLGHTPPVEYTLFGAPGSGSSIIEAVFAELGVPYRFRPIDARHHAQRGPEYAAVNPHRKMPTVITPDGETWTESAAILLALAQRHPLPALFPPAGSAPWAQSLRWLMFATSELYPLVEMMDYPERFAAEPARLELKARAHEHWTSRWAIVQSAVMGPFLLGEEFCGTDIYLAALAGWDLSEDVLEQRLPGVKRLRKSVAARPALSEVWTRNFPNQS